MNRCHGFCELDISPEDFEHVGADATLGWRPKTIRYYDSFKILLIPAYGDYNFTADISFMDF